MGRAVGAGRAGCTAGWTAGFGAGAGVAGRVCGLSRPRYLSRLGLCRSILRSITLLFGKRLVGTGCTAGLVVGPDGFAGRVLLPGAGRVLPLLLPGAGRVLLLPPLLPGFVPGAGRGLLPGVPGRVLFPGVPGRLLPFPGRVFTGRLSRITLLRFKLL